MSSQNKTALITGSTSGIGLATARALAKRGVNVIITGLGDQDTIKNITTELKRHGVRVDYVSGDLNKRSDIEKLWSDVIHLYQDGVDILINNAGVFHSNPVESLTDSQWDMDMAVMVTAPFQLIKRCLPLMKKKGWGRIINNSSSFGLVAMPCMAGYVAAKHGLIGLTKAVALETAAHGVTCNAVCPAVVDTKMLEQSCAQCGSISGHTAEEMMAVFKADSATGRCVKPEQVAELIEFLCLSNASSQITGAAYSIDCRKTAK